MAKGDHIFTEGPIVNHQGIDCGDGTVRYSAVLSMRKYEEYNSSYLESVAVVLLEPI